MHGTVGGVAVSPESGDQSHVLRGDLPMDDVKTVSLRRRVPLTHSAHLPVRTDIHCRQPKAVSTVAGGT